MISSYQDAINSVKEMQNLLRDIDLGLCRKGGHPDEAQDITDQPLFNKLAVISSELRRVSDYLETKVKEKCDE